MKKFPKKILSFLLAASILICSLSLSAITVSAQESIKTQAEAVAWLNSQQDAVYDFDGAYGTQCVEFVKAYVNWLCTGNAWSDVWNRPTLDGDEIWKNSLWAELGWTVYENTDDFLPLPGDIFSAGYHASGGTWRHTGVVISSDLSTAVIAEANARSEDGNGDPVWIRTITWKSSSVDSPYGATHYIRPNFKSDHTHNYTTFKYFLKTHPHYNCYACSCGDIKENTSEPVFYYLCETCLNTVRPSVPEFNSLEEKYIESDDVVFSWDATDNTSYYNILIEKMTDGEYSEYESICEYTETGLTRKFEEGSYRAKITSFNSEYDELDGSSPLNSAGDYSYFVVESGQIDTATITYNSNGGTNVPDSQSFDVIPDEWTDKTLNRTVEEEKTQYRYRTKETKTSTNSSLDGWTLYDKEISGYGEWSAWSSNPITSSEYLEVKTQYVPAVTKQVWNYSRDTGNGYSTYAIGYYGNPEYIQLDYALTAKGVVDGYTRYGSYGSYLADYWWNESTETVTVSNAYTAYASRAINYTYYYYKWSEWSEWSDEFCESDDNTSVGTRTVYKYDSFETLSDTVPERDGYSFLGWSTDENSTTGEYQPGDSIEVNSDTVLYAVWKLDCKHVNTVIKNVGDATCTSCGYSGDTYCADCGEFIKGGLTVPELGHDYKDTVTAPTATSKGYTTHTCTRCGNSYVDNYTEYVGENDPKIVAESKRTVAGKTVEIAIKAENNPGLVSMTLRVSFDSSVLTLKNVADGGILGSNSHKPELTSPYTLAWVNDTATENFTENGTIVTLTFEVASDAEIGNYPITVSYDYDNYDIYDKDVELVKFATVNGNIEVSDVIIGDVNGDGVVNNKDRLILTRYLAGWDSYGEDTVDLVAADVNGDGNVNNKDRLILTRHLAGWEGYEILPCAK